MKRLLFTTILIAFVVSACGPSEADIQKAIAQTQAAIPTATSAPAATSTPTVEDAYCSNFAETSALFEDLAIAVSEWNNFLKEPVGGSYPGTWDNMITSAIEFGPFVGQDMKNSENQIMRDGVAKFMALSKKYEDAGVRLQLQISSVEPPQNLRVAHDAILGCIEPPIARVSAYRNYFENGVAVNFPDFKPCASSQLYYQQIQDTCK